MTPTPKRQRGYLTLTFAQAGLILALLTAISPGLIFIGKLTARVINVEEYMKRHDVEATAFKEMILRDNEQLKTIADNQREMAHILTDTRISLAKLEDAK